MRCSQASFDFSWFSDGESSVRKSENESISGSVPSSLHNGNAAGRGGRGQCASLALKEPLPKPPLQATRKTWELRTRQLWLWHLKRLRLFGAQHANWYWKLWRLAPRSQWDKGEIPESSSLICQHILKSWVRTNPKFSENKRRWHLLFVSGKEILVVRDVGAENEVNR